MASPVAGFWLFLLFLFCALAVYAVFRAIMQRGEPEKREQRWDTGDQP